MKLIKPTFEIWEQGEHPDALMECVWSHVARCVRVCYQSESVRNPSESDEAFVKRVIFRKEDNDANHLAMLEHGTIYLTYRHKWTMDAFIGKYLSNPYSEIRNEHITKEHMDKDIEISFYITTNLRVLVENGWLDDLKYICLPTKHHARRVTVCFNTNIGVSREFNRHRVNSVAEESTRYCNYSKERFGGELKIGISAWLNDINQINRDRSLTYYAASLYLNTGDVEDKWSPIDYYLAAIKMSEFCYNGLIKSNWTPQQAREVLPLATKTQLIHTAFIDDWIHFFKLRAKGISGNPHPNAKLLAEPLMHEFINLGLISPIDLL